MSSDLLPYWHHLLRHFEKKGYVHNGLTIPFLVGSIEILEPNTRQWTIDKMIESLCNHGCTILKCPNIGEYVIGSLDGNSLKNKQLYHCPCDNVLVIDDSLNNVRDFSSLKGVFKELYESRIEKKEFSKNGKEWTYFIETDLVRMMEIN